MIIFTCDPWTTARNHHLAQKKKKSHNQRKICINQIQVVVVYDVHRRVGLVIPQTQKLQRPEPIFSCGNCSTKFTLENRSSRHFIFANSNQTNSINIMIVKRQEQRVKIYRHWHDRLLRNGIRYVSDITHEPTFLYTCSCNIESINAVLHVRSK